MTCTKFIDFVHYIKREEEIYLQTKKVYIYTDSQKDRQTDRHTDNDWIYIVLLAQSRIMFALECQLIVFSLGAVHK